MTTREAILEACIEALLPYAEQCVREINRIWLPEEDAYRFKAETAASFGRACLIHRNRVSQQVYESMAAFEAASRACDKEEQT